MVTLVLFQGCSVKQDDLTWLQGEKHTVNAPFYTLAAVGGVATVLSTVIVAPVFAPLHGIIKGFHGAEPEGDGGFLSTTTAKESIVDITYMDIYFLRP